MLARAGGSANLVTNSAQTLFRTGHYQGQHPFNIEGKMFDHDRTELTVLLHVDENNRLLELEIIRWAREI